eukprot:scaffold45908_cov17-Tisochrysis_lutea.AAC.4
MHAHTPDSNSIPFPHWKLLTKSLGLTLVTAVTAAAQRRAHHCPKDLNRPPKVAATRQQLHVQPSLISSPPSRLLSLPLSARAAKKRSQPLREFVFVCACCSLLCLGSALGSACTHAAHAQPPPLLLIIPPCDRGVQVKTRKRNIVVPSDPGSFSDAVVQIIQDAGENKGSEADLEAGAKALDAAELEYARYGDTLFEVFFTGGRLATGATLAEGGARLQQNVGTPRGWVAMNTRHAWGAQYQA